MRTNHAAKTPATRRLLIGLAAWAFGALAQAATPALRVERVELGDDAPGVQAYNLQELAQLRVFARSAAGFKHAQIFLQRRSGPSWRAPELFPFADPRWCDSDPHLSADGKRLSFVSDRAEQGDRPLAHLHLFESRWENAAWTAPQRLPEALQSQGLELGPERYGQRLFFASTRLQGGSSLRVFEADLAAPEVQAVALPAPINEGAENSDFTLTPDGRFALWWSQRPGTAGGADLYLAERVGSRYGPALRLPEPVNGPGIEFTPSVSADGRWLYFASTRDSPPEGGGLSHVYRVDWPAVLESFGPQLQAFSDAELDRQISALWRALGSQPGQGGDAQAMGRLLHPQLRVYGQQLKDAQLGLQTWDLPAFMALVRAPSPRGQQECELQREKRRYGAHVNAYSVVETQVAGVAGAMGATGVNSMQWQLGPQGWQLLSLHYAMELPGLPWAPATSGARPCLG